MHDLSLETLALFTLTEFAMALSPGPAVLLIMSQGLRHGWRGAAQGALGIEIANTLYFLLSAVGLSAVLLASEQVFIVIKWLGAGYLLYLGVRLLRSSGSLPADGAAAAPPARGALIGQGVVTQLANPKALLFFTALLPQFVDPQADVVLQFSAFALLTILTEYPILLAYGWLADRGRRLASGAVALRWFDRVAGVCLLGAGARLALLR